MKFSANLTQIKEGILVLDAGYDIPLEAGKRYTVSISPYKSSRSLEQNRLMWKLIQEIAKHTGNDEMDIYISGLEKANAKCDFIMALPETEDNLRRVYRAVKVMGTREYNDKLMYVFKCYVGSSKFNTEEMTFLIEHFLTLATEYGIEVDTDN
jgi:hypothetical protein